MTLGTALNVENYDSFVDWVPDAVDQSGVDEETLWNTAEKLLLEPESMEHIRKELRLKILYEVHLNRLEGHDEDSLGSWVNVRFDSASEVDQIQFSYGMFNVPLDGDEEKAERMKKVTREEGLEVQMNDPDVIVTRPDDRGPVWGVRITKRILQDVYNASLADITWVEEVGWSDNLTWEEVAEYR